MTAAPPMFAGTQASHWKFQDLLSLPGVRDRWEKVRRYFFLRESTYDMTNVCNMDCDGCYFFQGEKQFTLANREPAAWRALMKEEKARGITYVVLAGAEPSLVPELCQVCSEEISHGAIATNGLKALPESVDYRVHVSVWGNDATSLAVRKSKNTLHRQLDNYQGDPRAVFVYTYSPFNIEESQDVVGVLAEHGCKVTFNMFSAPVGYTGSLGHTAASLAAVRKTMLDLMERYPRQVLFTPYNVVAHTHTKGLHDLFGCSYPRQNPSMDIGLGRSFRQYRTDLTWDRDAACCVPDTDCDHCRHYASGSAIVTARLHRHAGRPETFKAWLDYVDTYLSIWVMRYEKGETLMTDLVAPPG